jgi:hypothetical protein
MANSAQSVTIISGPSSIFTGLRRAVRPLVAITSWTRLNGALILARARGPKRTLAPLREHDIRLPAFAGRNKIRRSPSWLRPETDFATSVLETEIVVTHIGDRHVYHFPILSNGTVSLHGSRIEPNPNAKREARRYLFEAHDAARIMLGRSKA